MINDEPPQTKLSRSCCAAGRRRRTISALSCRQTCAETGSGWPPRWASPIDEPFWDRPGFRSAGKARSDRWCVPPDIPEGLALDVGAASTGSRGRRAGHSGWHIHRRRPPPRHGSLAVGQKKRARKFRCIASDSMAAQQAARTAHEAVRSRKHRQSALALHCRQSRSAFDTRVIQAHQGSRACGRREPPTPHESIALKDPLLYSRSMRPIAQAYSLCASMVRNCPSIRR